MRLASCAAIILTTGCIQGRSYLPPEQAALGQEGGADGSFSCRTDPGLDPQFQVGETAVPTVFDVGWLAEPGGLNQLAVFDAEGSARLVQPDGAWDLARNVALRGLRPNASYDIAAVFVPEDGAGPLCSARQRIQTGGHSSSLPVPYISSAQAGLAQEGYRFVPLISMDGVAPAVLDSEANVVWASVFDPSQHGQMPMIFGVSPLADGSGVAFNTQETHPEGTGLIHRVTWAGEALPPVEVPTGHTDFAELPDGNFAMLGWDVRDFDGDRRLLGDTILETREDGEVVEIWNVYDHFEPDLSVFHGNDFFGSHPEVEDWSHANWLKYVAEEDAYYLTMETPAAVVKVDRGTGETTWVLSGDVGDFSTTEGDALINYPHSAEPIDGGVNVFNRRDPRYASTCSSVDEIEMNHSAGEAQTVWTYEGDRCAQIGFLGNSLPITGGHTVVSWSSMGVLDELGPEGDLLWQASLDLGAAFGFVDHRTGL